MNTHHELHRRLITLVEDFEAVKGKNDTYRETYLYLSTASKALMSLEGKKDSLGPIKQL